MTMLDFCLFCQDAIFLLYTLTVKVFLICFRNLLTESLQCRRNSSKNHIPSIWDVLVNSQSKVSFPGKWYQNLFWSQLVALQRYRRAMTIKGYDPLWIMPFTYEPTVKLPNDNGQLIFLWITCMTPNVKSNASTFSNI